MSESTNERQIPNLESGSPPLAGERVTFTGTLASMTHQQASRIAEQHGGTATSHVSRQTTMLVIGEEGWPLEADGRPSQKLRYADELRRQGHDLKLVRESEWLHLLGLEECRREVHRLYTPAMLSQLLRLPVGVIRGWERAGLIRAVRRVYRLPYFDFQEVTCARRITELLAAGVSRKTIQDGLQKLQALVPDVDRPLAGLDVLARGSRLLYRDGVSLVESTTGQRCFDFDAAVAPPDEDDDSADSLTIESAERSWGLSPRAAGTDRTNLRSVPLVRGLGELPTDWHVEGCRLLDDGDVDSAVESFRMFLMERPGDAEANFHLAEALYRQGNPTGAIERYYAAVEADHDYIEAWTGLACLLAEVDQTDAALEALGIALSVHPDYPDAHLHTAEILHQQGELERAVPHWRAYLKFDNRGPWAEQARQKLEEAGISPEAE